MELWSEVRRRVSTGELSKRAACLEYGIHWQTLAKMLQHAEPPGYRQTKARPSKLDAFLPVVHEILIGDRQVHRKQRHTSKRVFERLRDEHGYDGRWHGRNEAQDDHALGCQTLNRWDHFSRRSGSVLHADLQTSILV